ncbi:(Fe-S)-binding protein [Paenibacillus profundus]|uniref:(Fe-S)-binding protein n=1 Tax=Paenibacillus profundus TaxID=1173085 RepID=A0ABS8Y8T0_9BACL|nr:(Fe-S)-binding protein [Paenibacillus profundus]MCE5168155.1 (Fe-S)-binding protein [Paenibacillus profundus]
MTQALVRLLHEALHYCDGLTPHVSYVERRISGLWTATGHPRKIQVFHHTEWLHKLWLAGRLRPVHSLQKQVAWHDSCYLARSNGVLVAPRQLLKAIPGLDLLGLERHA